MLCGILFSYSEIPKWNITIIYVIYSRNNELTFPVYHKISTVVLYCVLQELIWGGVPRGLNIGAGIDSIDLFNYNYLKKKLF